MGWLASLIGVSRTGPIDAFVPVIIFAILFGLSMDYILGGEHVVKLVGVGLPSAVLLDALIVRSILTPALMLVIGERQWSLPKGLDRLLPHLEVEGDVRGPAMPPASA
jgi:putative drug exporter of the RND superfamily